MTRDDIIDMYEKANGWSPEGWDKTVDELERFANLVIEKERKEWKFRLKVFAERYNIIRKHRDVLLAAQIDAIRTKEQE